MATLKYPTPAEFRALYKKFPGGTDAEFANFLEKEGYGNFKGLKYKVEDIETKRRRLNIKSKAGYFRTRKSLLAEAKELGVTQSKGVPVRLLTQNELNRVLGDKRGVETKKLKRLTIPGFAEADYQTKLDWKKRNPEKVKASDLAYRQKKNLAQRIAPPAKTAEQALFRDLWRIAQDKKGTLRLKPVDKSINILQAKNFYSNKNKIIDTKNKLQYNFDNFKNKLNKKNVGRSFEQILEPFKQKYFIAEQPGLRTQINSKMLPGWDASKKTNYFEVQHVQGRNVNPYNVHLSTGKPNKLEGKIRTRFEKAWDLAKQRKLKNKNFNLLGAQKNALTMFTDSMAEVEGIASQPSMITRAREFGERPALSTMLRDVKKEGVKLPQGILKQAGELFNIFNTSSNTQKVKTAVALGCLKAAEGGRIGYALGSATIDCVGTKLTNEPLQSSMKLRVTEGIGKIKPAATNFLKILGRGGARAAPLAALAGVGAVIEPLVRPFVVDDPTTYLTDESQMKGMLLSTIEGETPKVDEEILKWQYPGLAGATVAGAVPGAREAYLDRLTGRGPAGPAGTKLPAVIAEKPVGKVRAALGIKGVLGKALGATFSPLAVAATLPIHVAAQRKGGTEWGDIATDPFNWMAPAFASSGAEMATRGMKPTGIMAQAIRLGMSPRTLSMISRRFGFPGLAVSAGMWGYDKWKNRSINDED